MPYAVVIEPGADSVGAYVPDLPGCVAVGETEAEARALIREAIALHLDRLRLDGEPVPPPSAHVECGDYTRERAGFLGYEPVEALYAQVRAADARRDVPGDGTQP